jgi:hypothetical protein
LTCAKTTPGRFLKRPGVYAIARAASAGYLPVPLRLTFCGLLAAVSANCNVSVFAPWLCGVNFTPTLHDEPLLSVSFAVQLDDEIAKLVPVRSLAEIIVAEAGLLAGLVSVTVTAELECPVFTLPNEIDVRDNVNGAGVGTGVGVCTGVGVGGIGVGVGFGVGLGVGFGVGLGVAFGVVLGVG